MHLTHHLSSLISPFPSCRVYFRCLSPKQDWKSYFITSPFTKSPHSFRCIYLPYHTHTTQHQEYMLELKPHPERWKRNDIQKGREQSKHNFCKAAGRPLNQQFTMQQLIGCNPKSQRFKSSSSYHNHKYLCVFFIFPSFGMAPFRSLLSFYVFNKCFGFLHGVCATGINSYKLQDSATE